ncbi:protein TALPID3 [Brachyistius frenatus]|uniref:protein TALPID3 n=1 Tax=Brachyistius frenatus TaxID=100188 RepID=UPI0037E7E0E8
MFSRVASNTLRSPDQSSCSSDTGDVLIRSTRVPHGPGPGSVRITVQKLRDPARPPSPRTPGTPERQELRQKRRRKPDDVALLRAAADSPPGRELLTSRFAAGGRGFVLAALKQRSHSAPHRRLVRVQMLDPKALQTTTNPQDAPRPSSHDAAGVAAVWTEAVLSSGRPGDATNAAATAAAAAVAAAAPLIKAQSDMEARVSQLADGVQRLLQADREGGGRGWSQQTLQHLETLQSQQMQLQSQLLESALRIVTGHAPTTSDLRASGPPANLQVRHLDAAANGLSNQQLSSPATGASAAAAATATVETVPVAMETRRRDQWPEQTRDNRYIRGASTTEGSHPQSLTHHSQEAARTANEVLREMRRLKTEMKTLLTQSENYLENTRPAPDHTQSQQNQSQSQLSKPHQNQFQQTPSLQTDSQQNHFQLHQSQPLENHLQSQTFQFQQNQSHSNLRSQQKHSKSQSHQSHQTQSQQNRSQYPQSLFHRTQSQPPQESQSVHKRPAVLSTLEEASQVLRQVRRQKKVLEENVESVLRANSGEVLHCQLEALAANRDWSEEVRIKKTVDAWINTLTRDIQVEISSEDTVRTRGVVTTQQRAGGSSAHTERGKPVRTLRGTGSKPAAGRGIRGQTARNTKVRGAEPDSVAGGLMDSEPAEVDGEPYLTRLYGRAPYEGLRRTLKKSPYLRFSSPASPLSRKPRPQLVERVRGVKLKSCKTQTSLPPPLSLAPPLTLSPAGPLHRNAFSSSHLAPDNLSDLAVTAADSYPVAMAIPLGRPRMNSSSRCGRPWKVTSPPATPSTAGDVAADSEAPEQQKEQLDAEETPPPLTSSHTVNIIERTSEEEEDKEENVFPGTDFLFVADVVQEEESVVGEEAVELDGGPTAPPVVYQGPVFPPQAPSALPAQYQVPVLAIDQQRDILENRLVEWVEQQLMARLISDMYCPPTTDPAQNEETDQSELKEESITSDIVEAAGGGGLQLFVDSNIPVDSELIRQLVNEVLAETIAVMLGRRDTLESGPEPELEPPGPELPARQEDGLPRVPTPVLTPPPSPAQPCRENTPIATPPPSEPTSLINSESPQPITPPEPVATPTQSPEPAPSVAHQAPPPHTWEDTEPPLDEERPDEHMDTHKQLLMSVAEEEPPLCSPLPPPARSRSPPHEPKPVSPAGSSEASSSSSSSSSSTSIVTAGTEATLKQISEGELLISVNHLATMTEEEAICSFSSSLQELQDMDFDPPSEGQVEGHYLMLTRMEQRLSQRGERPQPEGSWGREEEQQEEGEEEASIGEVRDDWTTKPPRRGQTSSPGQISQAAEVSFKGTDQDSVAVGNLMVEPIGTLTSDLNMSLSLPPHLESTDTAGQVVLVRQYDRPTAGQEEEGGAKTMHVYLPSIRLQEQQQHEEEEEEEMMLESVGGAADTDSSISDVF